MSFVRTLLDDIAKEMGRAPSSMDQFVLKLEENMCDTREALQVTTIDELVEIGLPKLIAIKIKKNFEELASKNTIIKEEVYDTPRLIRKYSDENPYEYIDTCLRKIYDNYLTANEKLDSLEVLKTIITNLLTNPEEAKYRSLKKNNNKLHNTLWRYLFMEQLFITLGFEYDDQTSCLAISEDKINMGALLYLNDYIRVDIENTKITPRMDPYKPGFSSTNPNFNIEEVGQISGYENSKFTEQLDELKKERDRLIKQHKIGQNVKLYLKGYNQMISGNNGHIYNEKEDKEVRDFELKIFKTRIAEFQNKHMKDIQFSSARKKEFEEFLKKPLYLDAILKVKLPNGSIIEANFASNQLLADVFKLLDQYLFYKDGYYLYIAPNIKIRYEKNDAKNLSKRLVDLGMVPDAVLTLLYIHPDINKSNLMLIQENQRYQTRL